MIRLALALLLLLHTSPADEPLITVSAPEIARVGVPFYVDIYRSGFVGPSFEVNAPLEYIDYQYLAMEHFALYVQSPAPCQCVVIVSSHDDMHTEVVTTTIAVVAPAVYAPMAAAPPVARQ